MSAYRCSGCGRNWPTQSDYRTCPVCGDKTWPGSAVSPMPVEEAQRLARHAAFDRYYERESAADITERRRKYAAENAERDRRFDEKVSAIEKFREIARVF